MVKTISFSLFCLLISALVICWVAGVLPTHGRLTAQGRAARPGKTGPDSTPPAASDDGLAVYFSPNGGCTEAIVREINNAKQCVYVQSAQFTSAPIAKALVAAHERGLDVRVVLDRKKDDEDHSQTRRLIDAGVPAFADARHHTAHNKVMIIDHRLVITGSFNFTWESESDNAENLVFIEGKAKFVSAFEANFKEHLGHSTPYGK